MESQLTIVMPAYNEEKALISELPKILMFCHQHNWRLLITDDGSTDNTKQILEQYKNDAYLRVLHHKVNRGYGGALKSGILAVRTEYLATMDADGQHRLEDVKSLFTKLHERDADLIIGSRDIRGSATQYRGLGKSIIRTVARILVPNSISDLNSGMKLYRSELAKQYIILCPDSMAFSDVITLVFINQGHLVIEYPIVVNRRLAGRSTISTRTAVTTMLEIFNLLMLFDPIRLLFPVSLITIITGIGWSIQFFIKGRGLSVVSLLLLIDTSFPVCR